jgi:hypothetical protein
MQVRDHSSISGRRACGLCRVLGRIRMSGLVLGMTVAGCSSYSPPNPVVGLPLAQVEQAMGPATGRYTLADGTMRVEFARGPMGRHTWMMDLDRDARVARSEQVLTEAMFRAVRDGESPQAVLQRLGRPSETRRGGLAGGEVWNWRYDDTNLCQWFELSVIDGKVLQPAIVPDPRCDVNDKTARE